MKLKYSIYVYIYIRVDIGGVKGPGGTPCWNPVGSGDPIEYDPKASIESGDPL